MRKPLPQPLIYPTLPEAFHHPRGRVLRALGRAYLRLAGWRIEGGFPPAPKMVLIVAPHTSNWDFFLGIAVLLALELRVSWLGKHAIFRPPVAGLLRGMGGIPVNRSASHGVVGACVEAFKAAPALILALAPEGTRKGVSRWKTGFYHIAMEAGVPILPVGFDFREHKVHLMPLFQPCGDLETDLPRLQSRYAQVHGLRERPCGGPKA